MNTRILTSSAVALAIAGAGYYFLRSKDESSTAGKTLPPPSTVSTHRSPETPSAPPAEENAEIVKAQKREALPEKPAVKTFKANSMEDLPPEARAAFDAVMAQHRKAAEAAIEREISSLKRSIPNLTPDQEKKIRELLSKNLPGNDAGENGAGIMRLVSGGNTLDSPETAKAISEILDDNQKTSFDALVKNRADSRAEANATRAYGQAINKLPDLDNTKKEALHDYFSRHTADATPPTREQQKQELASFLSPDEVDALGDTHPRMLQLGGLGGDSVISFSAAGTAVPAEGAIIQSEAIILDAPEAGK